MKHRTEIDGLRSLAVLPVILNHAKFSLFPGGFVGVDIFFVISGFLISDIIWNELESGRFSLVRFYERRARRIVPALAFVILLSFGLAYFTMLPEDLDNFSQSVVATLFFANNVLLTLTSGYWELNSDFKPLLHTWSLGVEEQFYVVYPLLLILIYKWRRGLFAYFLGAGILFSLAASVALTPSQPDASFYMIHTRAWELFLGALAAHANRSLSLPSRANDGLSMLGMALILASIFLFSEALSYPSFYPVIPCTGTALILLFARPGTMANRILSIPILVGVGLISYSAYLWHQPVFAFARIMSVTPPSVALMAVLCLVTLVLSYFTWCFVEQPFRDRRKVSVRALFMFAGVSTFALVAPALYVYSTAGLPERVPGIGLGRGKHIAYNERIFAYKKDAFASGKPRLLVVGSSTARDLVNVMIESGKFARYDIIYRDDLTVCGDHLLVQPHGDLIGTAGAIVWAASFQSGDCDHVWVSRPPLSEKPFVLVGPKHFGYNLNAYIATPEPDRPAVRAALLDETIAANAVYRNLVPASHYVDLIGEMARRFGGTPVFDGHGEILSADRVHLTAAGARLFAGFAFDDPAWAPVFALEKTKAPPAGPR